MAHADGFPGLQEPFVAPTINLLMILDVSPSMEDRWPQTISGLNEYFASLRKDQKDNEQDYKVTIVTFSNRVETIYDGVVLDKIPTFTEKNLSPYGSGTALYKAIVETLTPVNETGPVLVVIVTDGEDNSSTRDHQDTALKLIDDRQKLGNYTYAYLGVAKEAWGTTARVSAFRGASSNNVSADANLMSLYAASDSKSLTGSTLRYSRAMRSASMTNHSAGAPVVSMNVSKFFDDTEGDVTSDESSPACATSNATGDIASQPFGPRSNSFGWQTGNKGV